MSFCICREVSCSDGVERCYEVLYIVKFNFGC